MGRPLHVLLAIATLLLAGRAVLPEAVEWYVNRVLDGTEGFDGRVEDVDLALWRGGYVVEGLRLDHETKRELRPLLSAERVDLSLQWRALLRGELAGRVEVVRPVYNVVAAPPPAEGLLAQTGERPELAERLSALSPFSIDELEVRGGELHYRDPHRTPPVDVALTDLEILGRNWSNLRDRREERFGRAWVRGRAFRSAHFAASLEANPLASPPNFVFAALSRNIELVRLNEFLRAYGGFDVAAGHLDVYAEVEARDGRFEGYVKPIVRQLDVLEAGREQNSWLDTVWEGMVGVVAEIFENQALEQQATRIPIEGEWGEPAPDLATALATVLYNAFVQALPQRLEHPDRLAREPEGARGRSP